MQKLLLLDLDGTIRRPKSGATFINDPKDQEIIPESLKALLKFKDWICVGITNQGGVAAGHKSLDSAIYEQFQTLMLLPKLDTIFFCPDFEGCFCKQIRRKHIYQDPQENLTEPKLIAINAEVIDHIKVIDHITSNNNSWNFRKPSPGMINLAINTYQINKVNCLMVGDRTEDKQAALTAGIEFLWVHDWWEQYGR